MSIFGHQPDGFIYIDALEPIPDAFYFEIQPEYSLPVGAVRREYMPGEYHRIAFEDGSVEDAGPWPLGDRLIAEGAEDAQTWLAELAPVPELAPELSDAERKAIAVEQARQAALRALDEQRLAEAAKAGNVPTEVSTYLLLKAELEAAARA